MMRKNKLTAIPAAFLMLCSCQGEKTSPLGNLGQPSLSDSLVFFYGQFQGAEYLREAASDTVMLTRRERERFLKGIKDGLRAVEEVNDTYNRGLQRGVELALALYEFEDRYGIKFNRDLLYQSIAYTLESDTSVNGARIVQEFHEVLSKLDLKKHEEIIAEMHLTLPAEAKRLKMKKLTDDLYVTDSNPGTGAIVKRGDLVFATLNYILESGRNLEMPSSQQLIVGGPTMPEVMTRVYTRMRNGGTAQYATTAYALFGDRAQQLGLAPAQVILMSVEINNVENPDTTGKRDDIAL